MNTFLVNPLIPDGMMALVQIVDGHAEVIWYGPCRAVPETLFEQAEQTHVSQTTYDQIAAKAEATGKGQKLQ